MGWGESFGHIARNRCDIMRFSRTTRQILTADYGAVPQFHFVFGSTGPIGELRSR